MKVTKRTVSLCWMALAILCGVTDVRSQVRTTVWGFVKAESGNPVLGATVRIIDPWDGTEVRAVTDSAGAYNAIVDQYKSDKRYRIVMEASGFMKQAIENVDLGGETTRLDVRLVETAKVGTLSGSVTDRFGGGLPFAITVMAPASRMTTADESGKFRYDCSDLFASAASSTSRRSRSERK